MSSQERTESEGFYEMLWDCDHCGQKGLLGKTQRHCAECGAPQNPDKRYFPSIAHQQKVEGHKYEGADRSCPACRAPMSAAGKNCTQCGSPLDGSKEVKGVDEKPVAPAPRRRRRSWPWVLGTIALVVFAIWFFFIRHHAAQMTVAQHRWVRSVAIEQFGDQQQAAWREQVPSEASFPTCYRKQRSTRQIPDGEDCHTERHDRKDGTFEQVKVCKPKYRSQGVDDDWCTFTVRRWAKVDETKLTGTGTTPAWPTQGLPPADAPAQLGARRSGARTETLTLDFADQQSCDVPDATWRKCTDGQKTEVEVRARSGEIVCSSL